jgi:hypothetical protein
MIAKITEAIKMFSFLFTIKNIFPEDYLRSEIKQKKLFQKCFKEIQKFASISS